MYPSYTNTPIGSAQPAQNYPASAPVAMPQKSSKGKKLAILGVIVITVLAIGLVAVLSLSKTSKKTATSVNESFLLFANYALFSESKTDAITEEYSHNTAYAIEKAVYNNDTAFLETAQKLFASFKNDLDNSDIEKSSTLQSAVTYYEELLKYGSAYANATDLSNQEKLIEIYNASQFNQLYEELKIDNYDQDDIKTAIQYRDAYLNTMQTYLSLYIANGCDVDECLISEELQSATVAANTAAKKMMNAQKKQIENLSSECWDIEKILNGNEYNEQED